jgi:lipoprotein NlpI
VEKARSLLLPYERPDRAPLNEIYQLCEGKLTAEQVAASLNRPGASPAEQGQREFYGQLYLGLDYAAKGEAAAARRHLQQALSSDWPFTAGYGPNYMWHVGRVQLSLLDEKPDATQSPQSAREPAPVK